MKNIKHTQKTRMYTIFIILGKSGLLLDSQHPEGWEKVKSLEARGGRGRLEVEEMPLGPPHFVTELMVNIYYLFCGKTDKALEYFDDIHKTL